MTPRTKPISDNSFLIEEAYNQEAGVVQHIFNYRRDREGDWLATFTQEWPLGGQPISSATRCRSVTGGVGRAAIGDFAINYRRQLLGRDDEPVWFSPRLSVVLPIGKRAEGYGRRRARAAAEPSAERALEQRARHALERRRVDHARGNALGRRGTIRSVSARRERDLARRADLNLMLETRVGPHRGARRRGARIAQDHFVLLPGLRGAINLRAISRSCPGFGVPIGLGPSHGERDLFLYLSFEHPFR